MFINVDFPAPFSPSNAWTSPGSTSNETSLSAATPAKCLLMPRITSVGSTVGWVSGLELMASSIIGLVQSRCCARGAVRAQHRWAIYFLTSFACT